MVRAFDDPSGVLAFLVEGGGLACLAGLGSSLLHVHGAVAELHVLDGLPETVCVAAAGRPLSDLVAHPVLDSGRYRVRDVREDRRGVRAVLRFRVPQIPLVLPWERDLAHELDRFR